MKLAILLLLSVWARAEDKTGGLIEKTIHAAKGDFKLMIEPGALAIIDSINVKRRKTGEYQKNFDAEEKRRNEEGTSGKLRFTDAGMLQGAYRTMKDIQGQPYQLWDYDLNKDGQAAAVMVWPAEIAGEEGLVVNVFNADNKIIFVMILTEKDTIDSKNR
jgi:hypothetical protein